MQGADPVGFYPDPIIEKKPDLDLTFEKKPDPTFRKKPDPTLEKNHPT